MAAYYKVEVSLGTNAVEVGIPSPQTVNVVLPLVGPQGPAGPQGEQGPPGEVSGSIDYANVTNKPAAFPPEAHTHVAADVTDFATAVAQAAPPTTDASLLVTGTLNDARLSSAVTASLGLADTASQPGHSHVAADVTDFNTAAAAAAPVASVAGKTGAVTLAVADVADAVATSDARLSDARTPTAHKSTHATGGTDALSASDIGAAPATGIDPTAITGTAVVDNDARLSDTRDPNAHAADHAAGGGDPVTPSSIGAQSIFEFSNAVISSGVLTASRAKIWSLSDFSNSAYNLKLPRTGAQVGDIVVIRVPSNASWGSNSEVTIGYEFEDTPSVPEFFPIITISETGKQYRFQCGLVNEFGAAYNLVPVDTHTHPASEITSGTLARERGGLEADVSAYDGLVKISGGSTSAVTVTSAGEALLDDADAAAQRTTLGLGTAATADSADFAAASHSHELDELDATGIGIGKVLTADGSNGASWEDAAGGSSEPADDVFRVVGSSDATKKLAFEVDGLTTATTRTLTVADRSGVNVVSDTSAGSGSDVVNNIVSLTQAEYDAITTPDAATLFIITD